MLSGAWVPFKSSIQTTLNLESTAARMENSRISYRWPALYLSHLLLGTLSCKGRRGRKGSEQIEQRSCSILGG
eukprot:422706-Ditylum_brightwellii.AAC.1